MDLNKRSGPVDYLNVFIAIDEGEGDPLMPAQVAPSPDWEGERRLALAVLDVAVRDWVRRPKQRLKIQAWLASQDARFPMSLLAALLHRTPESIAGLFSSETRYHKRNRWVYRQSTHRVSVPTPSSHKPARTGHIPQ